MYLGVKQINEYLPIPVATHRLSSGQVYAPTALTYSIYKGESTTGLYENVDMTPASPFDTVTGLYYARVQLTAAAGFVVDTDYFVEVLATVDGVTQMVVHTFDIRDRTGYSLSATGADLILKSSTFIQAIVAAINEFATYGLTALNTLLVTTGIKAASVPSVAVGVGGIQSTSFATGAIDSAALDATADNEIADAILDRANAIETSITLRQAFKLALAALAGKLSGAATTTVTIRNVGDTKNRIVATVDADGNRSAVTTDVS